MAKNEDRGPYGQRMIRFTVKFWTNNLPKGTNKKTAWPSGAITLLKNEHKNIKPDMVLFNSLDDFLPKFQQLIDRNDIKLVEVPKGGFVVKKFAK